MKNQPDEFEARRAELLSLKAGDYAVLQSGFASNKLRLEMVTRVTPTQIALQHCRYSRSNGRRIGGYVGVPYIAAKATPAQIAQFHAQQQAEKKKTADDAARRTATIALNRSLRALFPESFHVHVGQGMEDDEQNNFEVTFSGLSEAQVRDLARRLGQK